MTREDSKIIKNNPNKSPYELAQLGLSEDGMMELQERQKEQKINISVMPTDKHVTTMRPILSTLITSNDTGVLLNKKNGLRVNMTAFMAGKMARKYPNEFQLL